MTRKVMGNLFPRKRYTGGTTPAVYFPSDRQKLARLLGGATAVHVHVRVYDRSGAGNPSLDFGIYEGCMGDEMPREGLRQFSVTATGAVPALPWNAANMTSVPDDGRFNAAPLFGLLDIAAQVTGSAATWMEFEIWYTAEFGT